MCPLSFPSRGMMKGTFANLMIVGVGGFFGSILRYLISGLASRLPLAVSFPVGTLVVNILGCLLIGFLGGLVELRQMFSPEIRLLIFIGVLGGLTTFSTFGNESFLLLRQGQFLFLFLNIILQIGLGLFSVWLGYALSKCI